MRNLFRATVCLYVLLPFSPILASAFLPRSAPSSAYSYLQRIPSRLCVLYDPQETLDEFVEFPTASQRISLKKEASKRQARKELATFTIPEDETSGPFSDETLRELWHMVAGNELVLVRGISKRQQKYVFSTAGRLCAELEVMQKELPVTLLSTKGYTAILFSPSLPDDHPLHVPLYTSVGQKNTWRARPKPPRDNRGQIINPTPE